MSTQNRLKTRTFVAANDFRSVGLGLAIDHGGNFATAGGQRALGVITSRTNSGKHVTVADKGDVNASPAWRSDSGLPANNGGVRFHRGRSVRFGIVGLHNPPNAAACNSGDMTTMIANFPGKRPLGAGSGYL
jgi:hypothetical protein